MWITVCALFTVLASTEVAVRMKAGTGRRQLNSTEVRSTGYEAELGTNFFIPHICYQIEIEAGTPGQSFTVVIDTASPYTVLVDASCEDCPVSNSFDVGESGTFKKERTLAIDNLTGTFGRDTVALDADSSFTVSNQAVFILSKYTTEMFGGQDGSLGLGPGTFSHSSFVQSLKAQGVIDRAVFALYAPHRFVATENNDPVIWFGGWDTEQFPDKSAFAFVPANTTGGKWGFDLTQASFGSLSFPAAKAVIDTSESKLIVPKAVYDQIITVICPFVCEGNLHEETLNETTYNSLKTTFLTFVLNGHKFSLSVCDLVFTVENILLPDVRYLQIDWKAGVEEWRLGHGFLMNYYTLFDYDAGRVGFASLRNPTGISLVVEVILALFSIMSLLEVLAYLFKRIRGRDSLYEPLL